MFFLALDMQYYLNMKDTKTTIGEVLDDSENKYNQDAFDQLNWITASSDINAKRIYNQSTKRPAMEGEFECEHYKALAEAWNAFRGN